MRRTLLPQIRLLQSNSALFSSLSVLIIGVTASLIFWGRGDADAHTPTLFSVGLALLWYSRRGALSTLICCVYQALFALFLVERSSPHPILMADGWRDVGQSISLALCALALVALGLFSARRPRLVGPKPDESADTSLPPS